LQVTLEDGRTPLYAAAYHGHMAVTQQLLGCEDVDANAATSSGATPLAVAAQVHGRVVYRWIAGQAGPAPQRACTIAW
jgi:Ankyrin repeat